MKTPPTSAQSAFDRMVKIDWATLWSAIGTNHLHQLECDDAEGFLNVGASRDGDMHLSLDKGRLQHGFSPSFRARTHQGGGRHERTRKAMALLALAVLADKQESSVEAAK